MRESFRIGIDVGGALLMICAHNSSCWSNALFLGTNTDAVILRCLSGPEEAKNSVLARCKAQTTPDVTSGIARALTDVLKQTNINKDSIMYISIGTTRWCSVYFYDAISASHCTLWRFLECCYRGGFEAAVKSCCFEAMRTVHRKMPAFHRLSRPASWHHRRSCGVANVRKLY